MKERYLWLVAVLAVIGITLWSAYYYRDQATLATAMQQESTSALQASREELALEKQKAEQALNKEYFRAEDLKRQLDEAVQERDRLRAEPRVLGGNLDYLKEKGLTDPVRQLTEDLVKRTDLIPYPGVLGGTMAFRPNGDWAFAPGYVLASFDDGHYGGWAVLHYHVTAGKISWSMVEHGKY